MTDEGSTESGEWDIEAEWRDARMKAGKPADPFDYPTEAYEFSPILLIYVGLFLGPFSPLLFALILLKRALALRSVLIMGSVAVAAWLLLQGLTWGFSEQWSTFHLQFMRSGANFLAGAVSFGLVRAQTKQSHVQTRGTIFNTAVALGVVVAAFMMIPRPWLMILGR